MCMQFYTINEDQAREIAVNFLQQYNSIMEVKKPVFENGIWAVDVLVAAPRVRKFHVQINPKTGHILGF